MIKLSVMYPKSEGTTFDMDYYKTTHFEIIARTINPTRWEIDSGMDGPYIAIGHLYFESPDAMGAALIEAGESTADVPNFTNAEAVVQISEVVA